MTTALLHSLVESIKGSQGQVVAVAAGEPQPGDIDGPMLYLWIQCDDGIIRRIPATGSKVLRLGPQETGP